MRAHFPLTLMVALASEMTRPDILQMQTPETTTAFQTIEDAMVAARDAFEQATRVYFESGGNEQIPAAIVENYNKAYAAYTTVTIPHLEREVA